MTKTEAILIGRQPLTETSLIVFWCSPNLGLVKTVAKGARQPKSPFAGKLDLFVSAEIGFAASRRSDLHILRESSVLTHRFGLRQSYLRILAASYFVKLVEGVAEKETPIPDLHGLLVRALDYLERQTPQLRGVLHFERELARCLGIHLEAGGAAIEGIRQMYHSIPGQRQKLLEALKSGPATATDAASPGSLP